MDTHSWLEVTSRRAFQFFFEHLRDVTGPGHAPTNELLYNASVLAHFATTSTASQETFPAAPASLATVFDLFVTDRSMVRDSEIMEIAGAQCLLLTGFFHDQQKRRHQVEWYAALGSTFYARAAASGRDLARAKLMDTMSQRFGFWRAQHRHLAHDLREEAQFSAYGIRPPVDPDDAI
ncbi:MAG TPA: hypothetical protein VG736_06180 [Vicinamibacterales bacterium]|jgi:hypothetical protein|nr:hypothetical protein [Vicinamibacterales bacterium]